MSANTAAVSGPDTSKSQNSRGAVMLSRARDSMIQIPFLVVAAVLLIVSIFLPYWNIVLRAPQYPKGLSVDAYVNRLEDMRSVREVDGLNHYIGMIKLTDAATIERQISVYAIPLIAILAIASIFLSGHWRTLLRVPAVAFPFIFVINLFAWLYYAGHNLDPTAALSSSIAEFTPHILGTGSIGQFKTEAKFEAGFWLALAASVLVVIAIVLDWRRKRHASAG